MKNIRVTKAVVNNLGTKKDEQFEPNFQPMYPIARLNLYGETKKLEFDRFIKNNCSGKFRFKITEDGNESVTGIVIFSMENGDVLQCQFDKKIKDTAVILLFLKKSILIFNELNYADWKNATTKRNRKGSGDTNKIVITEKPKYHIELPSAAYNQTNKSEEELFEMLRNNTGSLTIKCSQNNKKPKETTKNEDENKGRKQIIKIEVQKTVRIYTRHKEVWFIRGHYDHYGHYHPFSFAHSKIAVGQDYSKYRVFA